MSDIRMDWETYNKDPNDHQLVDLVVVYGGGFPLKDADGNEVMSGAMRLPTGDIQPAWERIHSPDSSTMSTSLQSRHVSAFNTTAETHKHKL